MNLKSLKADLQKSISRYNVAKGHVEKDVKYLHDVRVRVIGGPISNVEVYINQLANTPKSFKKTLGDVRVNVKSFEDRIRVHEAEERRVTQYGGAKVIAGIGGGAAFAAIAPSAAMAVATTFGTASTGTAISALSGAAATNAALAWLGGGALAAGGGGIAGGTALLALANPVGIAIGATVAAGTTVAVIAKRKKIAVQITADQKKVEEDTAVLEAYDHEIKRLTEQTARVSRGTANTLRWLEANASSDYDGFTTEQKERLGALINNVQSLGELVSAEITALR